MRSLRRSVRILVLSIVFAAVFLQPSPHQYQYTVNGSALHFEADGIVVISANQALEISFADARPVAPTFSTAPTATPPRFHSATYENLWDGVTLVYDRDDHGALRSNYYIAPHAEIDNPVAQIRLSYNRPVALDTFGNMVIAYDTAQAMESAPIAWQTVGAKNIPVKVSFRIIDRHTVGFAVDAYDNNYPLVIDPSLTWNTFLGGSGQHLGYGLAVDASDNVYAVGLTNTTWNTSLFGNPISSISFQGGVTDGVVAKLNSSGALQWYRFFGGASNDALSGAEVDASGNVYIIGYAFGAFTFTPEATPTPVHGYVGGDIDAFVAKLDSSGNLLWDTYLGSTSNDYIYGIDLDADGNIYVGGESYRGWHSSFDHVQGTDKTSDGYQGYIAKLNNNGAYQWHRFLTIYGVTDVATDTSGNVYGIKSNWGQNYDTQVYKFNASTGAQTWSTTLGGSGADQGYGLDVDSSGNVYARGVSSATWGTSPLRAHAGSNDHFVAKLNSSGTLQWHTFLGSSGDDNCRSQNSCSLSLDSASNVLITGYSAATWGTPDRAHSGSNDGFVASLASDGSLNWNMFLGGAGSDQMFGLMTSASGDVYATGYTQQTSWGSPIKFPTNCFYCQSVAKIANSLTMTVTKAGSGSGTVTSSPAGVSCGATCAASFASGTAVTLTGTAASGSAFSGWSGGVCSGTDPCTVTMSASKSVTATFAPSTYAVTVSKQGSGSGTVTSSPSGISCGNDCAEDVTAAGSITLTATPSTGSTFAGWGGGGGCSGTGQCTVTANSALTVTATFTLQSETFSVIKSGSGSGTITSVPSGISCGVDCSEGYDYGTSVTLTASAAADSVFAGWGGGVGCTGTGTCVITTGASAINLTAAFNLRTYAMTVIKSGGGTGTVTSSVAGISCGSDCTENYNTGTSVTLTATAASGSSFAGWSGSGCSGTSTCTITISAAKSVTAGFVSGTFQQFQQTATNRLMPSNMLVVSRSGSGSGSVSSSPSGISCGSDCYESYSATTSVTLTATAATGSTFTGWSGVCSGTDPCTVSVSLSKMVDAMFTKDGGVGNNAPAIRDVAGLQLGCSNGNYCNMPSWTTSDDDGDTVATTWKEVGGSNLQFTADGKVDLVNHRPPRGVYYIQLEATDQAATTTSQTIAISVANSPPKVSDVAGYQMTCARGQACGMPSWSVSDVDEDTVAATWKEVGGSTLKFTDAGAVDLVNHRAKRGTYYVQYEATDSYDTTTSQPIAIAIPNNAPAIENTNQIVITDATYQDSKYAFTGFKRNLDIAALFTDYDDDNLSYSWSIRDHDADKVGFISTTAGSSRLRSRVAGNVVVTVAVDDGNGGITTQELTIDIPVPTVTEEAVDVTITELSSDGGSTFDVTGTFRSPVWPVALVNSATTATVALADTAADASVSKAAEVSAEDSDYDTYSFTATDVPASADGSQVVVDVYTAVNGENMFLTNKTLTVDVGSGSDTEDENGGAAIDASWGCSMNPANTAARTSVAWGIAVALLMMCGVRRPWRKHIRRRD